MSFNDYGALIQKNLETGKENIEKATEKTVSMANKLIDILPKKKKEEK